MLSQQLFSTFPCHTEVIEKIVKLVKESSTHEINSIGKDKYIKTMLKSRRIPQFESKQNIVVQKWINNWVQLKITVGCFHFDLISTQYFTFTKCILFSYKCTALKHKLFLDIICGI